MGKDAVSNTKKPHSPPSNGSTVSASPIIFIIVIVGLIALGLYFFKDKIFSKPKNLDDLPKEQIKAESTEPETVPDPEATKINNQFEELGDGRKSE